MKSSPLSNNKGVDGSRTTTQRTRFFVAMNRERQIYVPHRPVLYFGLIRHPSGFRCQRWAYSFNTYEATLTSEGPISFSKAYKALKDAQAIVDAIVEGVEHLCVTRRGDLFAISPRKILELVNAPKQMVEGRVKRLKSRIMDLMKNRPELEEARYRNMLAYRMKKA